MSRSVFHSCESVEWGTPDEVLDLARELMVSIDLDPASSEFFNARVGAKLYLTDGLGEWPKGPHSVLLNPPGGKVGKDSKPVLFWRKLLSEVAAGNVTHALVVGFNLNFLQTTQVCQRSALDYPLCVPRYRLRFVPDGVAKDSPGHGNCIVYVPGLIDETEMFARVFSRVGKVRV